MSFRRKRLRKRTPVSYTHLDVYKRQGDQVFPRQHLRLVEDDDTARDIVELAAAGGFVCEEGFKKLDVGGDDNGFVPIFGGEAARVDSVVAIIVLKICLLYTSRCV